MSLMKGKKGLIMGVANERSIAWGISQKLAEAGAELAFTYLGDALKKRVVPLAEKLNSNVTFSCDVEKKEDVIKLFEDVKSQWGEIDFVVHAIAFSDKSELSGEYLDTTRENFLRSMLISCFSFTEVAKEASKIMKEGGSLLTLTYESTKAIPNYNVMGVCKSALEASVKYLARDLGAKGMRVNAISAGPIKTLAASALSQPKIKDDDSSHNYEIVPGALTANRQVNLPSLADSDTFVMTKVAQTLENKTIDSATVNFPKINQILDTNGATVTKYEAFPNAVNFVSLGNEATGFSPSVYADGADTNISLALGGKGDGAVLLDTRVAANSSTMTASGNVDQEMPLTIFNSSTPLTAFVLDGTVIGELKYFVNNGTGTVTVQPNNFAGGTNTTFTHNQAGFMIWTGANWHLASKQ